MPNVVVIMNDSLRRDHIAAYGDPAPWTRDGHPGEPFIHTPNLDRLAAEAAAFDRFYVSSYPTIPCRTDLFTGLFGFPTRGWQPLESTDRVLSDMLRSSGALPMLVYDTPMLGNDSYNFTRGFAGYEFLRGQHSDRWKTSPVQVRPPAARHKLQNADRLELYLRNSADRVLERDWMCGKTYSAAMDWLERNRSRENFLLWIDMWDPHEPFDAPPFDLERYVDPAFNGESIIYPRYGRGDYMTDPERNQVRALYAALVTCVDRWLGRLLEKIESLGLHRNTLVVFLTDHGHLFGDHELEGKPTGPYGRLYEPSIRVSLLIREPRGLGAGRRIGGLVQHPDLLPTLLEYLGLHVPDGLHGRSLWPLIEGTADRLRDVALSGRFSRFAHGSVGSRDLVSTAEAAQFDGWAGGEQVGEPATVTTEEWALICPPGVERRELYHLPTDPAQERNVIADFPDVAMRLHGALVGFLEETGAPPERVRLYTQPQPRLELSSDAQLFTFCDERGLLFAFPTEAEAARMLSTAADATQHLRSLSFGELLERQPQALISLHEQYYRAEDLA